MAPRIRKLIMSTEHARVFAASSATVKEERRAKLGIMEDGTKSVHVPKRVWRPQVKNTYEEPEFQDLAETMDWLFEDSGKVAAKHKAGPEPRNDIIVFDPIRHQQRLDENMQWRDCPEGMKGPIEAIVKEFWDVFDATGMKRHILGYEFNIDTATVQPICCKQPRYGPHETRVITQLANALEAKGLIEDDEGPWGAMVVLAAKPNQGHVHWSEYIFRLCVSYRNLNAITRPFNCFIMRCDDAVEGIGDSNCFLTLDLDAGYWQVKMHEAAKEKTAFFTPEGKKHWKVMPMGILNAHAFFVAMSTDFKREWNQRFSENPTEAIKTLLRVMEKHKSLITAQGMESKIEEFTMSTASAATQGNPGSKVIVDDVMVHDNNPITLLAYFVGMLEVYKRYRVTVNLRKTRFFPSRAEFVGIDVLPGGNSPAKSKYETIQKMPIPKSFSDIRMIIGCIGFYSSWIPHYEVEVAPFRDLLKQEPNAGTDPEQAETKLRELWTEDHTAKFDQLKQAIIKGPVLQRADSNRRFLIKTDWSKLAFGAVLCQADTSSEAETALLKEIEGDKCEFDKTLSGLRLRPVDFASRTCKGPECNYHSYVGEAACGRWAFQKFRKWLVGREFTWITDCSGLTRFFEGEANITHTTQRWRLELLAYNFTIVHRPARMLVECDLLSRYESVVANWRETETAQQTTDHVTAAYWKATKEPTPLPFVHHNPTVIGPNTSARTTLAATCDKARATWIIGAGLETATKAMARLGHEAMITLKTDETEYWQEKTDCTNLGKTLQRIEASNKPPPPVEWIVVPGADELKSNEQHQSLEQLIDKATRIGLKSVLMMWTKSKTNEGNKERWAKTLAAKDMVVSTLILNGDTCGAPMASTHIGIIATTEETSMHLPKHINACIAEENRRLEDVLDLPNASYSDYVNVAPKQGADTSRTVNVSYDNTPTSRTLFTQEDKAPNLANVEEIIGRGEFLVQTQDAWVPSQVRAMRPWETLQLLGMDRDEARAHLQQQGTKWNNERARVRTVAPMEVWATAVAYLVEAESQARNTTEEEQESLQQYMSPELRAFAFGRINRHTTWPLPTRELWIKELDTDADTSMLMEAIKKGERLARARLQDKAYWPAYERGRLTVEDEVLYEYEEPKAMHIRQLRRAVVPRRLRDVIIAAYHATPIAGHMSSLKTTYRIATRYWWPKMTTEIDKAVTGCGHCKAANATSHKDQKILQALEMDEPFDVCGMDVWVPGTTKPTDTHSTKAKRLKVEQRAVLTYMCVTTGFVTTAFMSNIDSDTSARLAFGQFFVPRGMPKLLLLDEGSEFKSVLITMCDRLGINHYVVSPENHDGIINERFHRYLNKVQKIQAVDMSSHQEWAMNTLFATYAWNASPIAGTDIQRAFVAVGRHFNFPLDEAPEELAIPRIHTEGMTAVQRIEAMFPLWWRQKELIKILNENRRKYHRDLKNGTKKKRIFEIGDIVAVRKQIKSKASEGAPAKLTLRSKGPYRVIAKESDESYKLQKIPATSRLARATGRTIKESSFRMEKLPSHLVVHRRVDTPDTRLAKMRQTLAHNPLEDSLGIPDFGKYAKAQPDKAYAFEKLEDLWPEVEAHDQEDSSDEEADEAQINQAEEIIEEQQRAEEQQTQQQPNRRRRIQVQEQLTPKIALALLKRKIENSKDKLFLIAYKEEGDPRGQWYLVQVDEEATSKNLAKRKGQYHCRWYFTHPGDAKTKWVRDCRFWPLIKELNEDEVMGMTVPTRPSKVDKLLATKGYRYAWYQKEVNLAEDGMVGPFNFGPRNTIPVDAWPKLEAAAREMAAKDIDVSTINKIIPHREGKRKRG